MMQVEAAEKSMTPPRSHKGQTSFCASWGTTVFCCMLMLLASHSVRNMISALREKTLRGFNGQLCHGNPFNGKSCSQLGKDACPDTIRLENVPGVRGTFGFETWKGPGQSCEYKFQSLYGQENHPMTFVSMGDGQISWTVMNRSYLLKGLPPDAKCEFDDNLPFQDHKHFPMTVRKITSWFVGDSPSCPRKVRMVDEGCDDLPKALWLLAEPWVEKTHESCVYFDESGKKIEVKKEKARGDLKVNYKDKDVVLQYQLARSPIECQSERVPPGRC